MAQQFLKQRSFANGQISPETFHLAETSIYQQGARVLTNAIISKYGSVKKRWGSRFIFGTASNAAAALIPFRVAEIGTSFILEFSPLSVRIIDASTETVVTSFTTPYDLTQIYELYYAQSEDEIFFAHEDVPLQSLNWTDGIFLFSEVDTEGTGPFINDQSKLSTMEVVDGIVDPVNTKILVSSVNIFKAIDVDGFGTYWRVGNRWYRGDELIDAKRLLTIPAGANDGLPGPATFPVTVQWEGPWEVVDAAGEKLLDDLPDPGVKFPWDQIGILTESTNGIWTDKNAGDILIVNPDRNLDQPHACQIADPDNYDVTVTVSNRVQCWIIQNPVAGWDFTLDTDGSNTRHIRYRLRDRQGISKIHLMPFGPAGGPIELRSNARDFFTASMAGEELISFEGGSLLVTAVINSARATCDVIVPYRDYNEIDNPDSSYSSTDVGSGFTEASGFPITVGFHEDRLILGGVRTQPQAVFFSRSRFHKDFTTGAQPTDGFTFDITSDRANRVSWIKTAGDLLIGTDDAEFSISGRPLTTTNFAVALQTNYGGQSTVPVAQHGFVMFASRTGQNIRAPQFRFESEIYQAGDLTDLNNDIFRGNLIREMRYLREPDQLLMVVQDTVDVATPSDGVPQLKSFTFRPELGIQGWSPWTIPVISMAEVPARSHDQLWSVVKRGTEASPNYFIEVIEPYEDDDTKGFHDALVVSNPGGFVVSGLSHLEGLTVSSVADGAFAGRHVVTGGTIDLSDTLQTPPSSVSTGLDYLWELAVNALDFGDAKGDTPFRFRNLDVVEISVFETAGLEIKGVPVGELIQDGVTPEQFTGVREHANLGIVAREPELSIQSNYPFKAHVRGLNILVNVDD